MRILIIDTCGEVGSVALAEGDAVLAVETLPARGASGLLLPAVKRLLEKRGSKLAELDGIGVVSGPGSFTGVRVGLAAAKGLCCATGVKLAAVSRLELLASAAGLKSGCAVLDAGRGEFYLRVEDSGEERPCSLATLKEFAAGMRCVVAEKKLLVSLGDLSPELFALDAASALPLVLRELNRGGTDISLLDANYVRGERDIYARTPVTAAGVAT